MEFVDACIRGDVAYVKKNFDEERRQNFRQTNIGLYRIYELYNIHFHLRKEYDAIIIFYDGRSSSTDMTQGIPKNFHNWHLVDLLCKFSNFTSECLWEQACKNKDQTLMQYISSHYPGVGNYTRGFLDACKMCDFKLAKFMMDQGADVHAAMSDKRDDCLEQCIEHARALKWFSFANKFSQQLALRRI